MKVFENVSLEYFNTFSLPCVTKYFIPIEKTTDIFEAVKFYQTQEEVLKKKLVLGQGSNLLFISEAFNGVIFYNKLLGYEVVNETEKSIEIEVSSGVIWDDFVTQCVNNNWRGVENLTSIPGTVGAVPIQNIGAYGSEVKNVIRWVEYLEFKKLSSKNCQFGYRTSLFKKELKDKFFITKVCFQLSKIENINLNYKDLTNYFSNRDANELTIKDVHLAVRDIRDKKIPSPKIYGNAGSFFKNPLVSSSKIQDILAFDPDAPHYQIDATTYKIPAGWLIEQCGWKGEKKGQVGCHSKQSLVLLNLGGAKGKEVESFAKEILKSVQHKFGILLEPEVNFV